MGNKSTTSIFHYSDYKCYLLDLIKSQPNRGHGEKSRLARILHCNAAYITQVLSGKAQLNLEQAQAISEHFGHSSLEAHVFLLLVQKQRAGTIKLREYFEHQLKLALTDRTDLKRRLAYTKLLPLEQQATYYSAWYVPATHVLLNIPKYRTPLSIQRYLKLPADRIHHALELLVALGLANEIGGSYVPVDVSIHLGADSPFAARSHANWRTRTIEALDHPQHVDFHYSSVVAISSNDVAKVRAIMVEAIEEIRGAVGKSGEEELYCYTLDWFALGQPEAEHRA